MGIMGINMDNKIIESMIKKSPVFAVFIVLSYVLSKLLVIGAGIISNAIDALSQGYDINLRYLIINMFILITAAFCTAFLKTICCESYSINIQKDCRILAVKALTNARCSKLEGKSGIIINCLTSDMNDLSVLLSEVIPDIITYLITIITVGISIFKIEQRIFIGIAIIFPIVIPISNIIAKKINLLAKSRRGKFDELTQIAADNIAGIEVCRTYSLEKFLNKRIDNKAKEILANEYVRNAYQAVVNFITNALKWIPSVICSIIALILTLDNIITVGELMEFIILFNKISSPLSELPFRIIDAKEMLVSVRRINNIINIEQENSGSYKNTFVTLEKQVISCQNISLTYKQKILKNVSLNINEGEKIAIVGSCGSGKTTLFKILCGFEQSYCGSYKLYGKDFFDWDIKAARKLISYVPQNVFFFPGTIKDNITYGLGEEDFEVCMKNVISACEKAGIHKKIETLPDGYNTYIGENGNLLSGGERQRIAIARAIYKNAPIILMDEPTSAIDEKTELIINDTIWNNCSKQTMIIIAHRLSAIKNADRIYVMNDGEIAEFGKHEELLSKNGIYAQLYKIAVR